VSRWAEATILAMGGALGVNARYWLATALDGRIGRGFPWATLTINVSGSFALGVAAVILNAPSWLPHPQARLLVMVGFLSGYTTFSTFTFEAIVLGERWGAPRAAAYVAASVLGGLAAVVAGASLGRALLLGPDRRPPPFPQGSRSLIDGSGRRLVNFRGRTSLPRKMRNAQRPELGRGG